MPKGIGCFALFKNYLNKLYFLQVAKTAVPSNVHIINSLIATLEKVNMKLIIVASPSVKKTENIATAIPFNTVGGMAANKGIAQILSLPIRFIKIAESNVARVPRTISIIPKGLEIFDIRQPTVRPGIAAGVRVARMFNASERRN